MEINGYQLDETDPRTGRPRLVSGFSELRGRRHDRVRLLDLQRRVPRAGPQPRPGAQARRPTRCSPTGASPGRTTAASSTTAPRPTPRDARGRSGRSWSGGTPRQRRWVGADEPDFEPSKPPDYRPPPGAKGMDAIAGDQPFIMKPDGVGWLFAPGSVKDGPLPDALRAGRVAGGQPALSRAGDQPDGAVLRGAAQPAGAHARRRSTRSSPPPSASPSTT